MIYIKRSEPFSRLKPSNALHSHSEDLALQQTMKSNLAKVLSVLDNFHHIFLAFSSSLTAFGQISNHELSSSVLGVHWTLVTSKEEKLRVDKIADPMFLPPDLAIR